MSGPTVSECQLEPRPISPQREGSTTTNSCSWSTYRLMLLEHPAVCLEQRAHHPSPPGLDPGASSPSVNVGENQNEKSQVGRKQYQTPGKAVRPGASRMEQSSLPALGWPRLCPSLLLATMAIRSVLSSQVSHAASSGKARH